MITINDIDDILMNRLILFWSKRFEFNIPTIDVIKSPKTYGILIISIEKKVDSSLTSMDYLFSHRL